MVVAEGMGDEHCQASGATKSGVVSLKALDHHRPNREESAVLPLNHPPLYGRRSSVGWTYPRPKRRRCKRSARPWHLSGNTTAFTVRTASCCPVLTILMR